jgi:hypothetical protein
LNVSIIGVTLVTALFAVVAIEGKRVVHLSTYGSRGSRLCDPQIYLAVDGDCEPGTVLGGSVKKGSRADPFTFCTTLVSLERADGSAGGAG